MARKKTSDSASRSHAMPVPDPQGSPMATTDEDRQVQVSFRMPESQAAALEKVAASEDRTLSAELRRIIRRHLETQDALPTLEAV